MNRLRRFLRWAVWKESKAMSHVHVIIDRSAFWIRERNFQMWKRWLLRTLRLHARLGDEPKDKDMEEK